MEERGGGDANPDADQHDVPDNMEYKARYKDLLEMQNTKYIPNKEKIPENWLVTLADLLVLPHTKESPCDPINAANQHCLYGMQLKTLPEAQQTQGIDESLA